MYQKIYKCKMCNEIIEGNLVDDIKANIEGCNNNEDELTRLHLCENGNLGITEKIGYKYLSTMETNKIL